ncbi:MAG: hypothetical protein V1792_02405 [Pseudomonadota bacterium]
MTINETANKQLCHSVVIVLKRDHIFAGFAGVCNHYGANSRG